MVEGEEDSSRMVEVPRIRTSLLLALLLHLPAVTGQRWTVRDGDDATFTCGSVRTEQDACGAINWFFYPRGSKPAFLLIDNGQIASSADPARMRLTGNCSLLIKSVSLQDGGIYQCSTAGSSDVNNDLSVVRVTKHEEDNSLILSCSVSITFPCQRSVKWLYDGEDVDRVLKPVTTSQSMCSETVAYRRSDLKSKSLELFSCRTADHETGEVKLFGLRSQSSEGNTGEETTTKQTTTATPKTTATATTTAAPGGPGAPAGPGAPGAPGAPGCPGCSAVDLVMLVMRVAELLLITVITVLLFRAAGRQRAAEDNTALQPLGHRAVMRSGAADSQQNKDKPGSDATVSYENF